MCFPVCIVLVLVESPTAWHPQAVNLFSVFYLVRRFFCSPRVTKRESIIIALKIYIKFALSGTWSLRFHLQSPSALSHTILVNVMNCEETNAITMKGWREMKHISSHCLLPVFNEVEEPADGVELLGGFELWLQPFRSPEGEEGRGQNAWSLRPRVPRWHNGHGRGWTSIVIPTDDYFHREARSGKTWLWKGYNWLNTNT